MKGQAKAAPRRIVLTGTFDVRNYGDLLFPLIAAYRLRPFGMQVIAASPTACDTGWRDAMPPVAVGGVLSGQTGFDGLLIGGGNIIHSRPVTLPDYVRAGVEQHAYPDLWQAATMAAGRRGVPVAWNAPGVPHDFSADERPAVEAAVNAASHVSVRDLASARFLGLGPGKVVPDTALDLASLWPATALEQDFRSMLARQGPMAAGPFVAIHVKERSLDLPLANLAMLLMDFRARTGCTPILIGIGACHGDDIVTSALAGQMPGHCIDLSVPLGLKEIAAAIAFSDGYVGASLHGYVTAASHGRPGVIVGRPKLPKMAGLLSQIGRTTDEANGWAAALEQMVSRIGTGRTTLPRFILNALDAHWTAVGQALAGPVAPPLAGASPVGALAHYG